VPGYDSVGAFCKSRDYRHQLRRKGLLDSPKRFLDSAIDLVELR
jgi:hypothetical protein